MAIHIQYNGQRVNKAWKEQVKSSSSLTSDQKKQLINNAHKQVAVHNIVEAVWFVVKFIAAAIFMGLLSLLISYLFR